MNTATKFGILATAVVIIAAMTGCPILSPTYWSMLIGVDGDDGAHAIAAAGAGAHVLAGYTEIDDEADHNAYLVKINAHGLIEWQTEFGDERDDTALDVERARDAGFILAGRFGGERDPTSDGFVLKTNAAGQEIWRTLIDSGGEDYAVNVEVTHDGGYLVAAQLDIMGDARAAMIKFNATGVEQWRQESPLGTHVAAVAINGANAGVLGWWALVPIDSEASEGPAGDLGLICADANGNLLWTKTHRVDTPAEMRNLIGTADGGLALTGQGDWLYQDSHLFLWKTDANGEILWQKEFGRDGRESGHDLQQTRDGGYIIAGELALPGTHAEIFLLKTDSAGSIQWERAYGGGDLDIAYGVLQTLDGYLVAGRTESFEQADEPDHSELLLLKTDSEGHLPGIEVELE